MCKKKVLVAFPFANSSINEDSEEDKERSRRVAIGIILYSGDSVENAIFSIGESVCNPGDVFNKELGKKIALERAKHGYNKGAGQFKYNDLVRVEVIEGVEKCISIGRSPITNTLIPYGLINRIKMLIPRKENS